MVAMVCIGGYFKILARRAMGRTWSCSKHPLTSRLGMGPNAFLARPMAGGGALKLQFVDLYNITTRKNRSVQKELNNSTWMGALVHLSLVAQLYQFVMLWARL